MFNAKGSEWKKNYLHRLTQRWSFIEENYAVGTLDLHGIIHFQFLNHWKKYSIDAGLSDYTHHIIRPGKNDFYLFSFSIKCF